MSFESRAYARSTDRVSTLRECWLDCVTLSALVLAVVASDSARAGVNTFSQIGPEGGRINDIVYHPTSPSIVYAATGGGFYRSTDGAESWVLVSDTLGNDPRDITVHASAPSRVFIAVPQEGVFTSEDHGVSVAQLSSFPLTRVHLGQASFSADGTILYVSADGRVLRSTDLGSTWAEGGSLPGQFAVIAQMRVDPSDPDILYVTVLSSDAPTAHRSDDRGQTWTPIELPAVSMFNVNDLAIVDSATNRLWVTGQGGVWFKDPNAAWTNTNFGSSGATRLWIDPRNPSRVYAAGYDGLRVLPAEGEAWENIHQGARTAWPAAFAAHPDDPNRLLLGGPEGLALSLNGGTQWTSRHRGIHSVEVTNLAPALSSGRIYLSSFANGVHWIDTEDLTITPTANESLRVLGPYASMAITASPVHVISGVTDRLLTSLGYGIARSSDSGLSWQLLQNDAFVNYEVRAITSSSAQGSERILALTQQRLYGSMNRGDTWQPIVIPDVDRIGELISVAQSNPAVVLVSAYKDPNESFVMKSADGGSTWSRLQGITALGVHSIAVDAHDDRTIYVVADQHLRKSTNGGDSWSDMGFTGIYRLTLDPQNSQIMYGVYALEIRRSVDGGLTWQPLASAGLSNYQSVNALAIDPSRPHRLFVAHGSHSVKLISIEPDLALSFNPSAAQVTNGVPASFTYSVRNEGPFDATRVVTTIVLNTSATNISTTASEGSCTHATLSITCTMPILRADQSKQIVVTATHLSTGTFALTASVRGDQPDPVSNNNSAVSSIEVTQPSAEPTPPPGSGDPPATPPPSNTGGGGASNGSGGGGGSSSLLIFALIASLAAVRGRRGTLMRASRAHAMTRMIDGI